MLADRHVNVGAAMLLVLWALVKLAHQMWQYMKTDATAGNRLSGVLHLLSNTVHRSLTSTVCTMCLYIICLRCLLELQPVMHSQSTLIHSFFIVCIVAFYSLRVLAILNNTSLARMAGFALALS